MKITLLGINKICSISSIGLALILLATSLRAEQHNSYLAQTNTIIDVLPLKVVIAQAKTSENIYNRQETKTDEIFGTQDATTDEIFGQQWGYFHPYLSLKGEWTDNLYNINTDEKNNLLTIISPGIWVGYPRMKYIPVTLNPHNTAAGGMRFSVPGRESFERFQAYLLGGLDYKNYSESSELNYTDWRVEGLFQYSMPVGISFRILDKLTRDRDRYDLGSFLPEDFTVEGDSIYLVSTPSRIRDYYSNQANISLKFDLSERYAMLFDYINFYLDYDDEANAWLDRIDNRYSFSLNYNYSPKTTLFLQYNFADIRYDTAIINNSDNSFYYGGITWKGTAKTSIMAKGGYQVKEYDNIETDKIDTFSMEMNLNYLMTDKTKLTLNLYKALEETDSIANPGKDTVVAKLRYDQNFTLRIQGNVEFWYEISDYESLNRIELNDIPDNREDNRYLVRPAVQYNIRDWLMAELAYSYENRNSTDNFYDFTTQTIILSLNAAL